MNICFPYKRQKEKTMQKLTATFIYFKVVNASTFPNVTEKLQPKETNYVIHVTCGN